MRTLHNRFQNTATVLRRFGKSRAGARGNYLEIPVCAIARHLRIGQPSAPAVLPRGRKMAEELGMTIDD